MQDPEREPRFAHPVERELARAFDELGIAWRYEPRTFPLEWRDGVVAEIMYRRDLIRLGRRHGLPELERAARRAPRVKL